MKTIKKWVSLLLVASLVLGVITSCVSSYRRGGYGQRPYNQGYGYGHRGYGRDHDGGRRGWDRGYGTHGSRDYGGRNWD